MAGEEENTVYKRVDDGAVEGRGTVEEQFRRILRDGDAIAFMPEDVHSIRVVSEEPTRHFHLYGKSFAKQVGRVGFKRSDGTTFVLPDNTQFVYTSKRVDGR